jgi:hypothetical protein
MRLIEFNNGTGLCFNVLADRGMDLGNASWRGTAFGYVGKTGLCAPGDRPGWEIKRGWHGGLLYTCGLTNIGGAVTDGDELLPMHGAYNNHVADHVSTNAYWENGKYILSATGKTTESRLFGECVSVTRTILTAFGSNEILIHDEITNEGFEKTPFMLLYHMNFGWPLLSEDAEFTTSCTGKRPRDAAAEPGMNDNHRFGAPDPDYAEQVFYFDSVENSFARLQNDKLGFGVEITYDGKQLPYLMQWKMTGCKEYVLGIEPGTQFPEGRVSAREGGRLEYLEPGETRRYDLRLRIV